MKVPTSVLGAGRGGRRAGWNEISIRKEAVMESIPWGLGNYGRGGEAP